MARGMRARRPEIKPPAGSHSSLGCAGGTRATGRPVLWREPVARCIVRPVENDAIDPMLFNLPVINPVHFSVALLLALLLFLALGRWLGGRMDKVEGEGGGAMNGAVFALLGLLLAFTFSGAVSRFEERRALIVEETNAIGTAYLRLDLLPVERQPALRGLFRDYVQARLDTYTDVGSAQSLAAIERSQALQGEIWAEAVPAVQAAGNAAVLSQVTTALNQMFDMFTIQYAVIYQHPPAVIHLMLFVMACIVALLAGVSLAGRSLPWVQVTVFVLTLVMAVYVILDLEYPRLGLIRVDAADALLRGALRAMQPVAP